MTVRQLEKLKLAKSIWLGLSTAMITNSEVVTSLFHISKVSHNSSHFDWLSWILSCHNLKLVRQLLSTETRVVANS
jgi:hypothetical protein